MRKYFFVINTEIMAFHTKKKKKQKFFIMGAQNIFHPKYITWGKRNVDLQYSKVTSKQRQQISLFVVV
jgi:hypothetical protein